MKRETGRIIRKGDVEMPRRTNRTAKKQNKGEEDEEEGTRTSVPSPGSRQMFQLIMTFA